MDTLLGFFMAINWLLVNDLSMTPSELPVFGLVLTGSWYWLLLMLLGWLLFLHCSVHHRCWKLCYIFEHRVMFNRGLPTIRMWKVKSNFWSRMLYVVSRTKKIMNLHDSSPPRVFPSPFCKRFITAALLQTSTHTSWYDKFTGRSTCCWYWQHSYWHNSSGSCGHTRLCTTVALRTRTGHRTFNWNTTLSHGLSIFKEDR